MKYYATLGRLVVSAVLVSAAGVWLGWYVLATAELIAVGWSPVLTGVVILSLPSLSILGGLSRALPWIWRNHG